MYPAIYIFDQVVFLREILNNLGTVLGLVLMYLILYFRRIRDKRQWISFVVALGIAYPFAFAMRGLTYWDNLDELFTSGINIVGMVFVYHFAFAGVYRLICRQWPDRYVKAFGGVFFCVQHIFSRLGCYSLGCCYGVPYDGPFSITFPDGSNPYMKYGREVAIFPTQLFESFSSLILLVLLLVFIFMGKRWVYSLFAIAFSTAVIISEAFMFRYEDEVEILGFSSIQLACMIIIVSELIVIVLAKIRRKAPEHKIGENGG